MSKQNNLVMDLVEAICVDSSASRLLVDLLATAIQERCGDCADDDCEIECGDEGCCEEGCMMEDFQDIQLSERLSEVVVDGKTYVMVDIDGLDGYEIKLYGAAE